MSQRIKYTLYTLLGGLIAFPTAIMLTSHFTAAQKGMLHGTLSLILFGAYHLRLSWLLFFQLY